MELTIAGEMAAPFVRLDSRTLVLCSGPRAVAMSLSSAGRFVEETLMIVLDEGRATRAQGERVFGGFRDEEGKRGALYRGTGRRPRRRGDRRRRARAAPSRRHRDGSP